MEFTQDRKIHFPRTRTHVQHTHAPLPGAARGLETLAPTILRLTRARVSLCRAVRPRGALDGPWGQTRALQGPGGLFRLARPSLGLKSSHVVQQLEACTRGRSDGAFDDVLTAQKS